MNQQSWESALPLGVYGYLSVFKSRLVSDLLYAKQQVVGYSKSIDVKSPTPDRTLVVQAHAAKKVLEAGIRMQTVKH